MLSRKETLILFEILVRNKVTVKDIDKLCHPKYFFKMAKKLQAYGLVEKLENGEGTYYFLTDKGKVRCHIDGKDKDTPERIKPYIKVVEWWIP